MEEENDSVILTTSAEASRRWRYRTERQKEPKKAEMKKKTQRRGEEEKRERVHRVINSQMKSVTAKKKPVCTVCGGG